MGGILLKYEMTIKEACNSGFWSCLEPTDWIALVSVFIAMIAAIASWMAIYSQKRINEKNQEAIIVPGIKSVEAKIEHILSDWDVEGKIPKKFSNTKLPIWNYGNSPVFNVGYCYYIENIDDLIQEENKMGEFDNHAINVIKHEGIYELDIAFRNIENKQGAQTRKIIPYIRNVDVIQPKDCTNIHIPDYFIIMLNDYFINSLFRDKKPPILLLKIFYDDTDFNTWELQFKIFVPSSYQFTNEEELTTSFHYEVVQTKQKKKRLTVKENERLMKKRKEEEAKK